QRTLRSDSGPLFGLGVGPDSLFRRLELVDLGNQFGDAAAELGLPDYFAPGTQPTTSHLDLVGILVGLHCSHQCGRTVLSGSFGVVVVVAPAPYSSSFSIGLRWTGFCCRGLTLGSAKLRRFRQIR